MLKTRWCDYSATYILVKGTIISTAHGDDEVAKQGDGRKKYLIFKKFAPFREGMIERNYAQIDNVKISMCDANV